MKEVYIVECFDERGGSNGSFVAGYMGGSCFIASGLAFAEEKLAIRAYKSAKKDGLAASIRRLPLMGELPNKQNA